LKMSDRGWLFVGSVVIVVAALGCSAWLVATRQAAHVDGLFLLLTSLVVAFAFSLYIFFVIKQAVEEQKREQEAGKKAAAAAPKKEQVTAGKAG
jgi:membrane protein implicated in regulation of membrane protease activity